MSTTRRFLDPSSPTFITDLIEVEAKYQAARALYERISKDTGWIAHPNRDALLDELVVEGRGLRTICDNAITQWFAGG